jgi:hypothetical protein
MRKMAGKRWIIPNLDITNNNTIDYTNTYYYDPELNQLLRIDNIERIGYMNGDNLYTVNRSVVNRSGKIDRDLTNQYKNVLEIPVVINSNYDLWKTLGGAYSMGYDNIENLRTRQLTFANGTSTDRIAEIGNDIRIKTTR